MAYHEFIERVIEKDDLESRIIKGTQIPRNEVENTANACNEAYKKYINR